MGKKFKALMAYLRSFKKDEIEFSWLHDSNGGVIEWYWGDKPVPIIDNLYDIVIEIASSHLDELFDLTKNCYSDTERYDVVLKFYPKKSKAIFLLYHEEYDRNSTTQEYAEKLDQNDTYVKRLKNFFDREGIEFCRASYSGNYDDGDINSVSCDGKEFTGIGSRFGGNQDRFIVEDVLYDVLERGFGGWELDDGSDGYIEINKNLDVHIEHSWTKYEFYKCEDELEIKLEDL